MTITLIIIIVVSVSTATVLAVKLSKNRRPEPPSTIMSPLLPNNPKPSTIKISKKRPIDEVIEFINTDMTDLGYEDAKKNSDVTYEIEKIMELREIGKQKCDDAIREYKEEITKIEASTNECNKTGLLDTGEKLKARKKIIEEQYIIGVENIKTELNDDDKFKEKAIFSSYRRGFARWRKAIAEGLVKDDEVNNDIDNKD